MLSTLDARALRRGRHADRAAAALRPVHGRERVVPLLLVSEPDEAKALGGAGHWVGHHLRPKHRGVGLVLERLLQVGICDLRREVSDKDRILWRLLYALSSCAPVQAVAQGGALCMQRVGWKREVEVVGRAISVCGL